MTSMTALFANARRQPQPDDTAANVSLLRLGALHRRVRLVSGLILFAYVLTHLIDHALGNVSLAAMEAMLRAQKWVWQGVVGTVLLYGALIAHAALGLAALYTRRYVGWTPIERVQLMLGLAIPVMLANHIAVTRMALTLFGLDKGYAQEIVSLTVASQFLGVVQVCVLIVAWTHACIGLSLAFRLKDWFAAARTALLLGAILVPLLALLGFVQGTREVWRDIADPAWRAAVLDPRITGTPNEVDRLVDLRDGFIVAYLAAIGLVFAARHLRGWVETRRRGVAITYPSGTVVTVPLGLTVLDASRKGDIAHAAVCGGRGRCSTCRVRVFAAAAALPEPAPAERRVLDKIGADPASVRLACQLRPRGPVSVLPLVPPAIARRYVLGRMKPRLGEDRFVVAMFVDMRGSMRLSNALPPYDAAYLVRRFVELAARAVASSGGVPNQFLGDGIMALFGLRVPPEQACAQALTAAEAVANAINALNAAVVRDLGVDLRFGIGIHCGDAIVADLGFGPHTSFTAIGEAVNIAARLQSETRGLGCDALVSHDVVRRAGASGGRPIAIALRGVATPIDAHILDLARGAVPQPGERGTSASSNA